MSGNVLFPAARLPLLPSHPACVSRFLPPRDAHSCFPSPPELSGAAFILPPRHASSPMETPPQYDCFHTFICFKEYQLRTAYWSRVGNPPLQSNLQWMEECGGTLLYFLLPTSMPTHMLTPSKPGPPSLVPPFLSISDEADFSVS